MTNLTEQYRKGIIQKGFYYIKMPSGEYDISSDYGLYKLRLTKDGDKVEVLSEVPSYELWKAVHEQWKVLLEENKRLKHDVGNLGYKIKNQRHEIDNRLKEIEKLKEQIYEFAEANQSLRKKLDKEMAKNRIDYYNGSPMDYLDECERDRKKNKIYKNWINNINKELLTSELRKTKEGNLFIVNLLKKLDQVLGEE